MVKVFAVEFKFYDRKSYFGMLNVGTRLVKSLKIIRNELLNEADATEFYAKYFTTRPAIFGFIVNILNLQCIMVPYLSCVSN